MDLQGKVVLITGGRRVGRAVAQELAKAGAHIAMTYHTGYVEIVTMVTQIQFEYPVQAAAYKVDLGDETGVRNLLGQVKEDFHSLDGLVNMASVYEKDPPELTFAAIDRLFRINATSGMVLSRLFAETKRNEGTRGAPIVTFGDWACEHPYQDYGLYLAAKAALQCYMKTLQVDFADIVRVVNILPGLLLAPDDLPTSELESIVANTPTHNHGTPEQAAQLVRTALELDFWADDVHLAGGQQWRHRLS
jgi:NAD(P)-dependent dehydrogenase (short-subunit alcohol dehydrogenase family)